MVGNPEARIAHLNHNSVPSGGVWWNPWVVPRLLFHEPVGRCRDCRDRFSGSFQIFEMKMTFMNLWDGVEIIALS